jgi:hypothetical protein
VNAKKSLQEGPDAVVIHEDVVELLESGCALIVGTVDDAARPEATRAWGLQVLPDRAHVRVLVDGGATRAVANIGRPSRAAVTATDVRTFHSVQVKGDVVAVEATTDEDDRRYERFVADFFANLEAVDGTPPGLLRRLVPAQRLAFVMHATALFDQTPGPSAGAPLAAHSTR